MSKRTIKSAVSGKTADEIKDSIPGKMHRKGSEELAKTAEEKVIQTIQQHHNSAIENAVNSVKAAADCGKAIQEFKDSDALTGSFRAWIENNFSFTYRTAYRYLKLSQLRDSGELDFESVQSINEALRLGDEKEKQDEKKDKDERQETFVSHAMKIESWFTTETKKVPVDKWDADRRSSCKKLLEGVREIYDQL